MNTSRQHGAIMVFTRAPIAGETKTRLIPLLGAEGAARLHAHLISRTLSKVTALANTDIALWCTPSTADPFFKSCAKTYDVQLRTQCGDDLGQSMHHAFEVTLQSAPWAIVLGTDCPELQTTDVLQAIEKLQDGVDAVVGPAVDGGYYLLGLRQLSRNLFEDIPWGTEKVWEITRERLNSLGWSWSIISQHHDLDRPEDLDYFSDLLRYI